MMHHQSKAIELNNQAVVQLESGLYWNALETCHAAIRCLDVVQCRLPVCACRLLSRPLHMNMTTCVMSTISKHHGLAGQGNCSNNNSNNDDDADDDSYHQDDEDVDIMEEEEEDGDGRMSLWFEGNQSHVSGYEWVDCRPKPPQFHEEDNEARKTMSTHSSIQAEQRSLSHDFRLAFLSLDAVKMFSNSNTTSFQDDDEEEETYAFHQYLGYCDCATRWGIYHK